jgi:hypothetical protein
MSSSPATLDGAIVPDFPWTVTAPVNSDTWKAIACFTSHLDAIQYAAKLMAANIYKDGNLSQARKDGAWITEALGGT